MVALKGSLTKQFSPQSHGVGDYFADIIVEDRIILELKAIEKLQTVHEAQLLNYLKATGMHVGLLINFTHPKAEIKRMVLNLPEGDEGN